jgi:excisionase family DNA binding protein
VNVSSRNRTSQPTAPKIRTLIDVRDAAAHLGVSERTIRNYVAEGRLTAYRVGPQLLRFDLAEVDALAQPVRTVAAAAQS